MAVLAARWEEAWPAAQGNGSRSLLQLANQDRGAGTLPRRKPRPGGQALLLWLISGVQNSSVGAQGLRSCGGAASLNDIT